MKDPSSFAYIDVAGKITLSVLFFAAVAIALLPSFIDLKKGGDFFVADASTATTSVTVLNTPPQWTVNAAESPASSTSTPTNAGSAVTFVGTGTDANSDPYFLLICKTSSAPTGHASAPPTCNGGFANQIAISATTTSGTQATAATTTNAAEPESNAWFGWICDANPTLGACNATFTNDGAGNFDAASPYYVNHRPTFTVYINNSPANPGATVTFSSTSSDPDVVDTPDQVRLFVCKANDFTGGNCGAGGSWCSSATTTSNASCNTALADPLPDKSYDAFGFVIDNHSFAASGGEQGADVPIVVLNMTPTIAAASISVNDTDGVGPLTLTNPQGETTGFTVKLTVSDDNSCQNASGTQEDVKVIPNVFRSGVGALNCFTSGNYNPNNCYTGALATTTWNYSCTQDVGSCTGTSDIDSTWTCIFPLWSVADATDGNGSLPTDPPHFAENWVASAEVIDDNASSSATTTASTGNDLQSFLSFNLNVPQASSTIAYGGLTPGQQNDPLFATTTLLATGNVGLSENLFGADMCVNYPSCFEAATNTIPSNQQHYASSTVTYASGIPLVASSSPGVLFDLAVPKTTSTSTSASRNTFWGIKVPAAIQLAGDYLGVNTFVGVTSTSTEW